MENSTYPEPVLSFRSDGPVAAGMATMPSRAHTAPRALSSILPQVDRLYLFLDRFDRVPEYARDAKITVLRSQDYGDLRGSGKFLGLGLDDDSEFYVCADDDVLYPFNFVSRLKAKSRRYGPKAAFGVHGCTLNRPVRSYLKDRKVIRLTSSVRPDIRVDVIATCAALFATAGFKFDVCDWVYKNMNDLSFAIEASKQGVSLYLAARRRNWVVFQEENQADSIYAALRHNDEKQSALARQLLALERQSPGVVAPAS